jgi:hypothetical protein
MEGSRLMEITPHWAEGASAVCPDWIFQLVHNVPQ